MLRQVRVWLSFSISQWVEFNSDPSYSNARANFTFVFLSALCQKTTGHSCIDSG